MIRKHCTLFAALLVSHAATAQGLGVRMEGARQEAVQTSRAQRLQMLQALYHRRIDVSFHQTPAQDAFEYIRTALGVNLVVHEGDSAGGPGIDLRTPITLEMDDVLAVEALQLVIEQCSLMDPCTWQLRSSFIEVGTKQRLSVPSAREVRAFAVDEILFEPPDFDDAPPVGFAGAYGPSPMFYEPYSPYSPYSPYARPGTSGSVGGASLGARTSPARPTQRTAEKARELIEMIVEAVEPDAWTINGGTWASISYQDGALIITAPEFIHRQLFGYGTIPAPKP